MSPILARLRDWWISASATQKLMSIGGSVLFLILILGTYLFASRPRFVPLYSNLSGQDQSMVSQSVAEMQIDTQVGASGQVLVPEDKVDAIRAKLAQSGKQPQSMQAWSSLDLKENRLGETPAVERERLKSISEGEIARTAERMDGVGEARVHIALPSNSLFVQDQKAATASITIEQKGDTSNPNIGRAIAELARGAVEGLDLKGIVVMNTRGDMLFNGEDEDQAGGMPLKKLSVDEDISKKRQRQLQATLDSAFGAGAAIVSVHADVDMNPETLQVVSKKQADNPEQEDKLTETLDSKSGAGPAPVAGTAANISAPAANAGGSGAPGGAYKTETSSKKVPFKEERTSTTTKVGGQIRSMAINVLVDQDKIPDKRVIEDFVKGEVSNYADATLFTTTVTPASFNKTAEKQATAAAAASATQARMQQILSVLPIAALLLVALMVMRQVGKFARAAAPVPSAQSAEYALSGMSTPAIEATTNNLLALIGASEHGAAAASTPGLLGMGAEENLSVEDIKDRVHMPLEQLRKMANERPAVVGMLIKSMLLEDRR